MSNARAKARRRQKKGQQGHQGNRIWIWIVATVVPIALIGIILYNQSTSSSRMPKSTAVDGSSLPGGPLAEEIAATTTAADDMTATPTISEETPPPRNWPIGSADYCRRHPRFARQLGFNERSILTTSAPSIKGLVLIQPAEAGVEEQIYQDPTWDNAGYLGHMTFDPTGNVYVFPAPRVSLVDNPPEEQNTLYRVDTDSAQMSAFLTLTIDAPISAANPYGIMGTTYDCDTNSLYVSTVAGSTATEEIGKIIRIDLATESIVAELQGIDPFGLSVLNLLETPSKNRAASAATDDANDKAGQQPVVKRLYFGAARSAEVYSILLSEQGDFVGQPTVELALPETSLKPWRIVWDTNGDMVVRAMPFDFNLIATSERIEIPLRFRRDENGLWQWIEE